VAFAPALAAAQEPQPSAQHPLAGQWAGFLAEDGTGEFVVDLQVEGEVASGPIIVTAVGEFYVRDGFASANSVQFTSASLSQGEGPTLTWTGQLTGNNELAFTVVSGDGGPAREFLLKKRATVPGRH